MAERELIIKYRIDNESRTFAAQEKARLKSVEDAADKTAKSQAASNRMAAKESEKEWKRANAEILRDFKKVLADRKRDNDKNVRDDARSARESVRAWERANRETLRDFQQVQREKIKTQREADRAARQSAAAQVKAAKEAADAAKSQGGIISTLKGVAAGYIGISVAAKGLDFLNSSWESYNQTVKNAVVDLRSYREEVQELAALKDRLGNTTLETKDQLLFRSRTLQSRNDAIEFQKAAVGGGSAFIDKPGAPGLVSEAEYNRYLEFAGAYQGIRGESAESHGSLAGVLPGLMRNKGQTGDQLAARHNQITKLLDPGRFSSVGSGIDQFLSLSPLISSGLFGEGADAAARAAAMTSTLSISYKDRSGDAMQQLVRATVGGVGKNKAPKLSDEDDKMKIGAYLSSIGVTKTMTPDQIADRIASDVDVQERNAKAAGKEFTEFDYLQHMGYGAQEERNVLMDWRSRRNVYRDKMMPIINNIPNIEDSRREIREYQASDPLAQARSVDLAKDLSSTAIAAGPQETYNRIKEATFRLYQAENPKYFSGTFDEWDKNGAYNAIFKKPIIDRASQLMVEEANRVGVYIPQGREVSNGGLAAPSFEVANPLDYSFLASSTSMGNQQDAYGKYNTEIGAKGGNVLSSILQKLSNIAEKQLESQLRSEKVIREGQGKKGPVAKPAAGNVGRN